MTPNRCKRAGRSARPAALSALGGCVAAALCLAMLSGEAAARFAPPAVQAALNDARISDREVRGFYRARNNRPLWIRGPVLGAEAETLLRLIETADADGLDPDDYRPGSLAEAIDEARGGSPRALAQAELLLSRRFAEYVRDVRRPRDTGMIYADPQLAPTRPTIRAVLEAAASAPSLQRHLETIGWMNPIYGELRQALVASGGAVDDPRAVRIPPGPTLRPGATGDRVRMLRYRLGLDPDGDFDDALAETLRDFQAANGLPVDALAGPRTLAALNGGGGGRALTPEQQRQLWVNLQRARALPADPGRRYVLVDAAAARLWMIEDGRIAGTMRVVVGRVTDPTPMIAGMLRSAALNPYWNVPPDLVPQRIAPQVLRQGTSYLREKRYQVLSDFTPGASILDPDTIDWRAVAAGRRQLRVRQLPGPENAMGRMKFLFPNTLGVYLHDTPERDLLREASRQFSAGCVRVEDAPRLARWLFGRPVAADSREPEQYIALPEPVPVYITYLTAAPESGRIAFRPDVYNRDRAQLARLR